MELVVDHTVKMVGRARHADLRLDDPAVSRHHFHVAARENGVHLQLCTGAGPLVRAGREVKDEMLVRVGESFIVGDTIVFVAGASDAELPSADGSIITMMSALLSGPASEVRALAGIFALNEALMAASAPAVADILASWAKAHVACEAVEVAAGEAPAAMSDLSILEIPVPSSGTRILVPAHGSPAGWLAFTTRLEPNRVTDSLRRLLIVAAALYGSRRAQLSQLLDLAEEHEAFRRQALGSARAFLGTSVAAEGLIRLIPRLAASDTTVLLMGETGVGKTFVARLIHQAGPRTKEPLRVINCASIPENLIESELFGHARGAFSGAVADRPGAFEAAGRGTVLLDEIGELPLASQAKLLRVIEDKRFERLGSNRAIPLQARILAATNRDLEAMVAAGTFRQDLFFRLSVITTVIPPLRERGDDVTLLAKQILVDLAASSGRRVDGFSPEALDAIRRYAWPGNVRELRNVVERALVLGDGRVVDASNFPAALRRSPRTNDEPLERADSLLVAIPMNEETLRARNREAALLRAGGNKTRAAALLGIRRTTLYKK